MDGLRSGMSVASNRGYDFGKDTSGIIGAAIETHKELGAGFQEVVYQKAFALELQAAGVDSALPRHPCYFAKSAIQ